MTESNLAKLSGAKIELSARSFFELSEVLASLAKRTSFFEPSANHIRPLGEVLSSLVERMLPGESNLAKSS